ncbi:MAG: thioredoxin family protein [Candidatus Vogelbacteria bacterium]|nr:thioredoxin family protein [Candidatus Vogelbacteria bacterium]
MNNIKIEVLGSGCPTCKKLYELTKEAVAEMGLSVEVEYSNDIQKIISLGVMQSPVLAINGKPVMVGFSPDKEKIKKLISKN